MTDVAIVEKPEPSRLFAGRLARSIFRFMARIWNPPMLLVIRRGLIPNFGLIIHSGRRSGRTFTTPVAVGVRDGAVYIPLTLGIHSHWFQNVVVAGECLVVARGHELRATHPVVVEDEGALAFPRPLRWLLCTLGITRFLRLSAA